MEDTEIIGLFQARNEKAISETEKKYKPYLHTIALNILGDERDSEECLNDTYFKTWNAIPPACPEKLSTFLGKITRNNAIDIYKKTHAKKRRTSEINIILDEIAEIIPDKNDVESEIDNQEFINEINAFLAALSEKNRKIFVCRYYFADSIEKISSEHNMSKNNIYVILSRTRDELRKYLTDKGYVI